jgi:SHS family lactate transporter-like MFS transporter
MVADGISLIQMVSASSAQIEATAGSHLRTSVNGTDVPDYATIQGIFIGCVAAFTIFMVIIGPEYVAYLPTQTA